MAIQHRTEIDPLSPYVPGRPIAAVRRDYGLTRVVKLASNENPLGMPESARAAAEAALFAGAVYPDGACTALRERLAARYGLPPGAFVFGAGADEVISMIGKVFVNPGDACVTGAVTFSQYEAAVVAMGGKMVFAPMTAGHGYDLDAILRLITPRVKLVFIANPNNPTGTAFGAAEQAAFLDKVPGDVAVVLDEAYSEYAGDDFPDTRTVLKTRKNVILLKTFSKIYGLAGLRVGYGVMDEGLAALFERIRCPFNVSAAAQAAACAALDDADFLRRSVAQNAAAMAEFTAALDAMGVPYIPSRANFVTLDTGGDDRAAFEALMRAGYITRAGSALGLPGWLRVTLGGSDDMRGFVNALRAFLGK